MPAVFALLDAPPDVTVQVDTTEVLPQIAAFLAKHPGLQEVLQAGIQRLHHVFPDSREFLLALEEDPKSPAGNPSWRWSRPLCRRPQCMRG